MLHALNQNDYFIKLNYIKFSSKKDYWMTFILKCGFLFQVNNLLINL